MPPWASRSPPPAVTLMPNREGVIAGGRRSAKGHNDGTAPGTRIVYCSGLFRSGLRWCLALYHQASSSQGCPWCVIESETEEKPEVCERNIILKAIRRGDSLTPWKISSQHAQCVFLAQYHSKCPPRSCRIKTMLATTIVMCRAFESFSTCQTSPQPEMDYWSQKTSLPWTRSFLHTRCQRKGYLHGLVALCACGSSAYAHTVHYPQEWLKFPQHFTRKGDWWSREMPSVNPAYLKLKPTNNATFEALRNFDSTVVPSLLGQSRLFLLRTPSRMAHWILASGQVAGWTSVHHLLVILVTCEVTSLGELLAQNIKKRATSPQQPSKDKNQKDKHKGKG